MTEPKLSTRFRRIVTVGFLIFSACLLLVSQAIASPSTRRAVEYPPQMNGARVETYKTVGKTKLNLYIFAPTAASNAPAIVFFSVVAGAPDRRSSSRNNAGI